MFAWLHLSKPVLAALLAAHLSAGFDAWTTQRWIAETRNNRPPGYETNAEYRWASHSPALFLIMQDKAIITTLLITHTRPHTWKRKAAVAAAIAVAGIHLEAGIHNLKKNPHW